MTTGGWVTMIVSLSAVWAGTFWCFARVLRPAAKGESSDS